MLRAFAHPVACCWESLCRAKFETGQTFSPVQTNAMILQCVSNDLGRQNLETQHLIHKAVMVRSLAPDYLSLKFIRRRSKIFNSYKLAVPLQMSVASKIYLSCCQLKSPSE